MLVLVSLLAAEPSPPALDLPAGSPAWEVLRRQETRTGTVLRSHAAPALERSLLAGSLGQAPFDATLRAAEFPGLRVPLVDWADTARGNRLRLSPEVSFGLDAREEDLADSGGTSLLGGVGLTASGRLIDRLTWYTRGRIYTERAGSARFTHQFDPDFGETYSVEKGAGDSLLDMRTYNRFESYVLLDLPWLVLKAGRDRIHMGPGYFSSLTAGRDTPPYWLLEARVDFASWLTMDNLLLKMTDSDHDVLKFANLHRFEARPARWLTVAFQDIVLYEGRDPDWTYALPLVPLTFAEANGGGRDNAAMAFDFLCAPVPGVSFWGELFLDDLLGPGAFFDDFWENRWAGLAGFQVVSPWEALDADLVVEYGHVEPWTYNGRKPHTSFRHFNVPSASRLGPDSRTVDAQLSWRPLRWLELRSRTGWYEKGLGRQATLGAIHDDVLDGTSKDFLAGPTEYRSRYTQEARVLWGSRFQGRLWMETVTETRAASAGAECTARW